MLDGYKWLFQFLIAGRWVSNPCRPISYTGSLRRLRIAGFLYHSFPYRLQRLTDLFCWRYWAVPAGWTSSEDHPLHTNLPTSIGNFGSLVSDSWSTLKVLVCVRYTPVSSTACEFSKLSSQTVRCWIFLHPLLVLTPSAFLRMNISLVFDWVSISGFHILLKLMTLNISLVCGAGFPQRLLKYLSSQVGFKVYDVSIF